MKISIGADHAGVDLKDELVLYLQGKGHEVKDLGTHGKESVDYPEFARLVALSVCDGEVERGILVCGSGIGMAMAANRFAGVRAAAISDLFSARLCREHNDCNLLTLGSRIVAPALAKEILELWLATGFSGGRHQKRVDLIEGDKK